MWRRVRQKQCRSCSCTIIFCIASQEHKVLDDELDNLKITCDTQAYMEPFFSRQFFSSVQRDRSTFLFICSTSWPTIFLVSEKQESMGSILSLITNSLCFESIVETNGSPFAVFFRHYATVFEAFRFVSTHTPLKFLGIFWGFRQYAIFLPNIFKKNIFFPNVFIFCSLNFFEP